MLAEELKRLVGDVINLRCELNPNVMFTKSLVIIAARGKCAALLSVLGKRQPKHQG